VVTDAAQPPPVPCPRCRKPAPGGTLYRRGNGCLAEWEGRVCADCCLALVTVAVRKQAGVPKGEGDSL